MAETFRRAHRGPPLLLLPNAWDAMSARQFEAAGFPAVATTSGGIAWALGHADGEKAPWREVVAAHERIVRAVRVPVTADIEAGYGDMPDRWRTASPKSCAPAWSASTWRTARRGPTCRCGRSRMPSRGSAPRARQQPRPACRRSSTPGSISTSRTWAIRRAASTRRCGAARPISRRARIASIRSASPTWTLSLDWCRRSTTRRLISWRGPARRRSPISSASASGVSASPRAPRSPSCR